MPTQSRKTILLATDQQRSVLNALDANLQHASAYTPYGHRPLNGLLSLLGFNGEPMDLLTGHYHLGNGYRPFSPVLMRFTCPDSESPFGEGGLNAYAYCEGDPVNHTDPSGHLKIGSLLLKITKKAKTHHSQPKSISISTLAAIQDTAEELGGEKAISQLAKKANINSKKFLLEKTVERQKLKTEKVLAQKPSPRSVEDMENVITQLEESDSIYIDILVGTREGEFRPPNLKDIQSANSINLQGISSDLKRKLKSLRQNQ